MKDLIGIVIVLFLIALAVYVYFLPTIQANKVGHPALKSIAVVNIFLGWMLIPWVLALAWAYRHDKTTVMPSKKCPECAEVILAEAVKCKHCHATV